MPLPISAFDISEGEFHRRLAQPRAQGQWLWPEIRIEDWRVAREMITRALAEVLIEGSANTRLEGDPQVMSVAAYTAGIGPLIGWWIAAKRIVASEPIAALFDLHLRHNRLRMERLRASAKEILAALAQADIAATVLKGMHTAFVYFPDPATRPTSDIDLLVRAADAERASTYFREAGFVRTHWQATEESWALPDMPATPRSLSLVHADDPWVVDLHNSLDYWPRKTVAAARIGRCALTSVRPILQEDLPGTVLAQPTLLLHLAVHASHSTVNLTPLRMAELVWVIRRDMEAGDLSWRDFVEAARQAGALGIVYPALYFTERLVPGIVPATVLEASAVAAPGGVRRHVERLTPATAQRIDRISLSEHFMWSDGWLAIGGQIVRDISRAFSTRGAWNLYWDHAARLFQPRFSR